MKTNSFLFFVLLICSKLTVFEANAQSSPCNENPSTLKEAIQYFKPWSNDLNSGGAFLAFLNNSNIESSDFGDLANASLSNIIPHLSGAARANFKKCMIPDDLSKQLTGKSDIKLHYGLILAHPDKSIIPLLMFDSRESMGIVILDNNYQVLHTWLSTDFLDGKNIIDLQFVGDKFYTHSYGGSIADFPSHGTKSYQIDKKLGVKVIEWARFEKNKYTKVLNKLPMLPNLKKDDHESALAFFDKYGIKEGSLAYFTTKSGINLLFHCDRKDDYNFVFELNVITADGTQKGDWTFVNYFGGIASAEAMHYSQSDILFEGDIITMKVESSVDGVSSGTATYTSEITAAGIVEKGKTDKNPTAQLNSIQLPLKISASKRMSTEVVGNEKIISNATLLSEEQRLSIMPDCSWGPYDRFDMEATDGNFVKFKTTAGINVVAAFETASITNVLHLQVIDEDGKAIGKPLDYIISGSSPNAQSGNNNSIEILPSGDIILKELLWENDYNTGNAKPDSVKNYKMKITKSGIIKM